MIFFTNEAKKNQKGFALSLLWAIFNSTLAATHIGLVGVFLYFYAPELAVSCIVLLAEFLIFGFIIKTPWQAVHFAFSSLKLHREIVKELEKEG